MRTIYRATKCEMRNERCHMDETYDFTIEIPCDDDGFVLLQCPQCGELFKLRPEDYESDDVIEVSCPSCGIASDNYLTDEVVELARTKAMNAALKMLEAEMKKLERKTKGNPVSFKAGKPLKRESESALMPSIDTLSRVTCDCCGRQSKISRLLKMSKFVCPLCGVINFNDR